MNDSVSKITEINQYLINEINIEIFNKIKKEDHVFKDELVFFNNLCNDFIFFKTNSNNYSSLYSYFKVNKIVESSRLRFDISNHEHLSHENFEKELNFIRYQIGFYESLLLLVNNEYHVEKRNGVLKQSIGLIGKLIESYVFCQDRIFDIFHDIDMVESFETLLEIVEDIDDIDERITFINKAKHKYLECDDWFVINENDIPFDIRCDSEIEKLKELKKHLDPGYFTVENSPQQSGAYKPDEVLTNEFNKIFKNNVGFTIFSKMFELYKNETNHLANFSFLFYAMEKPYLVCSQTDFKEFLRNEKYNIEIEKIDSRQSGENKKSKLYNSIKESVEEKHGKSTI